MLKDEPNDSSNVIDLFTLNTSSGIPIYRQLVDQIKQAIRMQLMQSEQQLPSVRQLAKALQINPMTISKAFAQLELEGVLNRKRGVGMLVAKQQAQDEIPQEVSNLIQKLVKISRQHDIADESTLSRVQQALSVKTKGKPS